MGKYEYTKSEMRRFFWLTKRITREIPDQSKSQGLFYPQYLKKAPITSLGDQKF